MLGWKAGLPVFIFDVFKGWLAVMLADFFLINGQLGDEQLVFLKIALAAAVVLGHVFPMFAGFRGGKGVATLLGVGIALIPFNRLGRPGDFCRGPAASPAMFRSAPSQVLYYFHFIDYFLFEAGQYLADRIINTCRHFYPGDPPE